MKIEDLTAFVAVIRLQSTRLAAEELGLTQPAITRRVAPTTAASSRWQAT